MPFPTGNDTTNMGELIGENQSVSRAMRKSVRCYSVRGSILLKVYAYSRMDKGMEAQAKMIEAMGLNE